MPGNKLIVYGNLRHNIIGLNSFNNRYKDQYQYEEYNIIIPGLRLYDLYDTCGCIVSENSEDMVIADIISTTDELIDLIILTSRKSNRFHEELISYEEKLYRILLLNNITNTDKRVVDGDWSSYINNLIFNIRKS